MMPILKPQQVSRLSLYLIFFVWLSFFSLAIFFWQKNWPVFLMSLTALIHSLRNLSEPCPHLATLKQNLPLTFLVDFLFLGLILISLLFFAKLIKLFFVNQYFIHKLKKQRIDLSSKITSLIKKLDLENRIWEIKSNYLEVFCFGLIKPKICLSQRLVKELNDDELKAVLRHERVHLKSFAPLKVFLGKIITSIFFFFPKLQNLFQQYIVFSELSADEKATFGWQKKESLSSALVKILENRRQPQFSPLLVNLDGANLVRIEKLINSSRVIKFNFFLPTVLVSVFFMIVVFNFLSTNLFLDRCPEALNCLKNSLALEKSVPLDSVYQMVGPFSPVDLTSSCQ